MAIVVSILCQDRQKMRYLTNARTYVCDGSDHSSWKCKPTYRCVNGKALPLTDARDNPLPAGKRSYRKGL